VFQKIDNLQGAHAITGSANMQKFIEVWINNGGPEDLFKGLVMVVDMFHQRCVLWSEEVFKNER